MDHGPWTTSLDMEPKGRPGGTTAQPQKAAMLPVPPPRRQQLRTSTVRLSELRFFSAVSSPFRATDPCSLSLKTPNPSWPHLPRHVPLAAAFWARARGAGRKRQQRSGGLAPTINPRKPASRWSVSSGRATPVPAWLSLSLVVHLP